jgi:putative membrane protein
MDATGHAEENDMRFRWMLAGGCLTATLVAGNFATVSGQGVRGNDGKAATTGTAVTPPVVDTAAADRLFVVTAAMANMAEIQYGHLAIKKAQHEAVIRLAGEMVDDHIKAQNDLADAAYGGGVQWPKRLDDKHATLHQRLSALGGMDFDREYLKSIIAAHQEVEAALAARAAESRTAAGGVSGTVTEWSAKALPAVRAHLKEAQELASTLNDARSPRPTN